MHLLKGSRIALKAVTAHKLRALLAILGIVVGVVGSFILSRASGWPKVISPLVLLPAFGVSALVVSSSAPTPPGRPLAWTRSSRYARSSGGGHISTGRKVSGTPSEAARAQPAAIT